MTRFWVLAIGVLAMAPVMIFTNRYYKNPFWKIIFSLIILTVMAFFACRLVYFLENGTWNGQSFFGAVLLAPLMTWATAKILTIPHPVMMDLYAPSVCIMLAVQKVNCMRYGCCKGRVFAYATNGDPIRFPSEIVECATSLLICIFLFWLIDNPKYRGKLLPWYLVIYGTTRFVLNLLRDTTAVLWNLAYGNLWAVVSIIFGAVLLLRCSKRS